MSEQDALVERVAEKIHDETQRQFGETWGDHYHRAYRDASERERELARRKARAAIAAVREHDGLRLTWERGKFIPVGEDDAVAAAEGDADATV